jgi:hypothetical protein
MLCLFLNTTVLKRKLPIKSLLSRCLLESNYSTTTLLDRAQVSTNNVRQREAKGLNQENGTVNVFMRVCLSRMCYLQITFICV